MAFLNSSQWLAIKWYMKEYKYTMRDMIAGPIITFTTRKGDKISINITHIQDKYRGRPRAKAKKKEAA